MHDHAEPDCSKYYADVGPGCGVPEIGGACCGRGVGVSLSLDFGDGGGGGGRKSAWSARRDGVKRVGSGWFEGCGCCCRVWGGSGGGGGFGGVGEDGFDFGRELGEGIEG